MALDVTAATRRTLIGQPNAARFGEAGIAVRASSYYPEPLPGYRCQNSDWDQTPDSRTQPRFRFGAECIRIAAESFVDRPGAIGADIVLHERHR